MQKTSKKRGDEAGYMEPKTNIKALSQGELEKTLESWGVRGYRLNQIFQWLYQKDAATFDEMSNLSKVLRAKLTENFVIERLSPATIQQSTDGTRKFLFQLSDGQSIESVLIPNEKRQTLCISSQVGCAMACSFCLTGTLGLTRNLSHFEIVEQVMAVRRAVESETRITNIVYMGMGEPLHNLKNVVESTRILKDERGLNFSRHKITVSTCGLVEPMKEFGHLSDVNLAVSLAATTDEVRCQLMRKKMKIFY